MKRFFSLIVCCLLFATTWAQMNHVVEVESTYTPTLKDADKLNVPLSLPSVAPRHFDVNYDRTAVPTSTYVFQPMQAAKSEAAADGAPRGFVSLGGGTKGRLDLEGAYGLRLTTDDRLDFDVSLRGYSGHVSPTINTAGQASSRFYSTRGKVGYEHRFAPQTSLVASGEVESQVMNGQHNMLFGLDALLTPYRFGDFRLGGGVGFESFAQKHLTNAFYSQEKNRESHLTAHIRMGYDLGDSHALGMDLQADAFTYSYGKFSDNSTVEFHPYYTFSNDELQLRLGATLDLFGGLERKLRAAPDVLLRYHASDELTLFGQAGGGVVHNSYRHFNTLSPYWLYTPLMMNEKGQPQLAHEFDFIRSSVGAEWNVMEGMMVRLYAGFDKSKGRAELIAGSSLVQSQGWRWYGHLDLNYQWRDVLTWKVSGQYNQWKSHYGNNTDAHAEAVAWRPVADVLTSLDYRPIQRLHLGLDYQLQTFSERSSLPYRRPVTSALGAEVEWQLPLNLIESRGGRMTVYVRGDNLLNRRYDLWQGVRAFGPSVMGGVKTTF